MYKIFYIACVAAAIIRLHHTLFSTIYLLHMHVSGNIIKHIFSAQHTHTQRPKVRAHILRLVAAAAAASCTLKHISTRADPRTRTPHSLRVCAARFLLMLICENKNKHTRVRVCVRNRKRTFARGNKTTIYKAIHLFTFIRN